MQFERERKSEKKQQQLEVVVVVFRSRLGKNRGAARGLIGEDVVLSEAQRV